jgi:uncharacterized OB-fold protein
MVNAEHPFFAKGTTAAPYWEGLARGELLYQKCGDCGKGQLPPRTQCTHCLSDNITWQRASGSGRIVSWVVYHYAIHERFKDKVPYNVAIVELAEGARLVTNIVEADNAELRIGAPVELVIEEEDGLALARFRLAR